MCAINGCTGKDEALVARMNAVTAHRGPDGTGLWSDKVTLGHNRLSVIDLSAAAAQPMFSSNGRVVLSFNGEIYNFRELKAQLAGYPFKTESDTEVILAAYERLGRAAFEKLNGMFALALWDGVREELILARDRAGIKPLYYSWDEKRLLFSSEIKALLEAGVSRLLDKEAFNLYLRVLYVPGPRTMLRTVRKLLPGHILTWNTEGIQIEPYIFEKASHEKGPSAEELERTVNAAVKRQLVSDRPLGLYLSGGLDSSIVLDCAARERAQVDTYSVGFALEEGEEAEKFNADFLLARKTAHIYGARHHEVLLSSKDAFALLEPAILQLDEPIANPTMLPMLYLARETKPTATVVLSGDGGDELFGGYERYRLSLLSSRYRHIPEFVRTGLDIFPPLRKFDTAEGLERYKQFMFQKEALRVVSPEALNASAEQFFAQKFQDRRGDFVQQFMDVDRDTWLVDESLMRSDKMGMAYGVEVRVPFLDNEVLAATARIPRADKVTFGETKKILREAFRRRLPPYLFGQPKRGWFSPGAKWLRRPEFSSFAQEAFSAEYYAATAPLFRWDEVLRMLSRHLDGSEYNLTMLWAVLSFQIWARRYRVEI